MSLSLRGEKFNNEILGGSVTCYKGLDNKPWFVGSQIAKILGYVKTANAINRHVKPKHKIEIGTGESDLPETGSLQSPVLHPQTILISEAGFWSLVLRSKIPTAEEFKDWICEEVLPSIREQGYYALPGVLEAIKAINNREISELEGLDRKEFRHESLTKSDLSKNISCVESGHRGGLTTQSRWKDIKTENGNLKIENTKLKIEKQALKAELDEITAGLEELARD